MKIQPIVANNNQSKPHFEHVKLVLDKKTPVLQNYLQKAVIESACEDKSLTVYQKYSKGGFLDLLKLIDTSVATTEKNLNKCLEVVLLAFGLTLDVVKPDEDVFTLSVEPKEELGFDNGYLTKKHYVTDRDRGVIDPVYKRNYVAKLKQNDKEYIIYENEMGDIVDKWIPDGDFDLATQSLTYLFSKMPFIKLTPDCIKFVYEYLATNPIFKGLTEHKFNIPKCSESQFYANDYLEKPMQELEDWMKR